MLKAILALGLVVASSVAAQVPTGWVNIVSQNSGKCLDMTGGPTATSPGVAAQQWSCLGTAQTNQIFQLIAVSGGYEIQVKDSGLALEPNGGLTAAQTPIVQEAHSSADSYQIWTVTAGSTSGYYTLHPNSAPKDCMAAANSSTANGAVVWQGGCNGGKNQEWEFVAVSNPATITSVTPNSGPTTGETTVTVAGTNFAAGAAVTFGGTAGTNVSVVNAEEILATTPAASAGAVPVSVTNPGAAAVKLANGFTYTAASTKPTITFVQANYAAPQGTQATVAVPFKSAQSAGDLNVVVVGWNDSAAVVDSVADSAGNTYELAVGPTVLSGTASQSIYYAKNIAAGTNTVTVAFSVAAASPDIRVLEYKGADQYSPVDGTAANSGNSAASSSGSATTINATDLIIGANLVVTSTSGPGSGFTERLLTSPDGDIAEDQMTSSAGTYAAMAPLTSSGPWIMQLVAFHTPSGTTTTPPSANLTWDASTSSNVVSYNVYRATGSGALAKFASGIVNTLYTDNTVVNGQSYSYAATAVDSSGNESAQSNMTTVTIPNK